MVETIQKKKTPKEIIYEWIETLGTAFIMALIIRALFIQAYNITWLFPDKETESLYRRMSDVVTGLNNQYFLNPSAFQ